MDPDNDEGDVLGRLSRLARTERGALAALARAEGVSAEDAVDCVQDGLCTMLTMAQTDALPEDPQTWGAVLAGVVRNVARNRRRRHAVARPHHEIEEAPLAAAGPAADDVIARAEEHVRLRACVAELCEIQRAVVTLRMLEERPGEDVAEALGISAGHVAVLLHRAKAALHACMTAG
jgi:RNA polymerase sigma-70 factor (ECF subfamily)